MAGPPASGQVSRSIGLDRARLVLSAWLRAPRAAERSFVLTRAAP